jgi:hypothetical protein
MEILTARSPRSNETGLKPGFTPGQISDEVRLHLLRLPVIINYSDLSHFNLSL